MSKTHAMSHRADFALCGTRPGYGRYLQRALYPELPTCLRCLSKLCALPPVQILGLDDDANPQIPVRVEGPDRWSVRCPFCWCSHWHGAVPGAREPHCDASGDRQYVLVDPTALGVAMQATPVFRLQLPSDSGPNGVYRWEAT